MSISVIDGYPGCGKTSWAIQEINDLPDDTNIIYITPYLNEVQRIIDACPSKKFLQPSAAKGAGKKMNHLVSLISANANIVSTHALLSNVTNEFIDIVRKKNYILFLDEVFQTVEKWYVGPQNIRSVNTGEGGIENVKESITRKDMETLIERGIVEVDKKDKVLWVDNNVLLSRYEKLRTFANNGLLYFVNNSVLIWVFPEQIFQEDVFSEIYIMTHKFKSQIQSNYCDYFNLPYNMFTISQDSQNRYKIVDLEENSHIELEWKDTIRNKIHILEDHKINKIGEPYLDAGNHTINSALSFTWFDRVKKNDPKKLKTLRNNTGNYFSNIMGNPANQRMWTCFKKNMPDMISNRHLTGKSHIPLNARATNDFGDKTVLAYNVNRYLDTFFDSFFSKSGVKVDQNEFALSEMIQWIFRSAIRNNKDINIYIPSNRMRNLLIAYLNNIPIPKPMPIPTPLQLAKVNNISQRTAKKKEDKGRRRRYKKNKITT